MFLPSIPGVVPFLPGRGLPCLDPHVDLLEWAPDHGVRVRPEQPGDDRGSTRASARKRSGVFNVLCHCEHLRCGRALGDVAVGLCWVRASHG